MPQSLRRFIWCSVILSAVFLPVTGFACTTFFINKLERPILGTNYDWSFGSGMIVVNKRGVKKQGMPVDDPVTPPVWVSRYGSITFNQYGRETPMGGMNEAGLVVHQMMLTQGVFPKPDNRNPVKNLQWIQYQLDNFSQVEEVINSNQKIRIQTHEVPGLHYLAADRAGGCASLEWINGRLIVHQGESMPFKVLANNTYEDSMRYLRRHKGFGGGMPADGDSSMSLDRFVRAAKMVNAFPDQRNTPVIDNAFDVLRNLANQSTRWRIVYDIKNRQVHFLTHLNSQVRTVDMSRFDMSCRAPVKIIDLNGKLSGDISDRFVNYTWQINKKYIKNAFDNTSFSQGTPDAYIHTRSLYPDNTKCTE